MDPLILLTILLCPPAQLTPSDPYRGLSHTEMRSVNLHNLGRILAILRGSPEDTHGDPLNFFLEKTVTVHIDTRQLTILEVSEV